MSTGILGIHIPVNMKLTLLLRGVGLLILISQCSCSKEHAHPVSDSSEVRSEKSLTETAVKEVSLFTFRTINIYIMLRSFILFSYSSL